MLGAARIRGDEWEIDLRLHDGGELTLGLLRRFLEALQGHAVLAQVDALLLLELVGDPVDDLLVEVVTAEMRIAVGRLDLDHALADLEDRDVEGAAAQVVHGHRLVLLLVEAVREGGRGGLVHDAEHFEAGDGDRAVLGLDDLVGNELRFLQDLVVAPTHEALDGEDGVLRIRDRLPLRHLTDQGFSLLRERHDRGSQAAAFLVGDDGRITTLHYRHHGIRRSEVDTNHLRHVVNLLLESLASATRERRGGAPRRRRPRYATSILISLGLTASTLGRVTVSTPSR